MTYSRPSAVNPPRPLKKDQIAARRLSGRWRLGAVSSRCRKARDRHFHYAPAVDLVRQRPPAIRDDGARDRLNQNAVLVGYLLRRPYKDAARPVRHVGFDAGGNQPHDLIVEQLPVTGAIFVPDHQVYGQSFQTPVGVGLHQLAHQIDIGQVCDLQQHDRQIAGDRVAPQTGLPAMVLHENARVGAQRSIGVNHRAGQVAVQLRVGFGGVDLPQDHLAVGPGQFEDAIRQTPVLIFRDQAQARVAAFTDAGDNIDRHRFLGIEPDAMPDRHNRIQHRAFAARKRPAAHRLRIGNGVAAADELHAVRLIGDFAGIGSMHGHQVKHPGRLLVAGAGPPRAKNRLPPGDDLGLHKKIAECRLQRIGGG